VVRGYFAVSAAENKLNLAQRANDKGEQFLTLTRSLERGGEAVHSDVIKAELQMLERRRQLQSLCGNLLCVRIFGAAAWPW